MRKIEKNTTTKQYFTLSMDNTLTGLTSAYTLSLYNDSANEYHTFSITDVSTNNRANLFILNFSGSTLQEMIYDYNIYNSSYPTTSLETNKIYIYTTKPSKMVDTQSDADIKLIDNR